MQCEAAPERKNELKAKPATRCTTVVWHPDASLSRAARLVFRKKIPQFSLEMAHAGRSACRVGSANALLPACGLRGRRSPLEAPGVNFPSVSLRAVTRPSLQRFGCALFCRVLVLQQHTAAHTRTARTATAQLFARFRGTEANIVPRRVNLLTIRFGC